MKKVSILVFSLIVTVSAMAQIVRGTIVQTGSQKLVVYGKPSIAISNKVFTGVSVCLSIPDQGAGNPVVTMTNSYLASLDWTEVVSPSSPIINGGRAYYTFIGTDNGNPATASWTTGNNPIAEFTFSNSNGFSSVQLNDETGGTPDGGANSQMYWYVEILGTGDITDYDNKYYGTSPAAVNNFLAPSFVGLQPLSILPVTLVKFDLIKRSRSEFELKWEANEESNLDRYIIERSIGDNSVWDSIGAVTAKNYGNSITWYNFIDSKAALNPSGRTRISYRLKIREQDLTYKYSPIRSLVVQPDGKTNVFSIFPNPAKEGFNVGLVSNSSWRSADLVLSLSDMTGKIVSRVNVRKYSGQYYFNTKGISAGMYTLSIHYSNGEFVDSKLVSIQ